MVVVVVCSYPCYAQRHEQLLFDFQVDYPFANRFLLEATGSYQTVLTKDRWRSVTFSPTFEYIFTAVDLTVEIPMTYTLQHDSANTYEISPLLGARIHISQNKRVSLRFTPRYQYRCFREVEAGLWDISNRTRLKGEVWVTINGPNLFTDNLWYVFADYEEFIVVDDQVDERFANRRMAKLGVGYRLNYKNRFEVIYIRQNSRNEIGGEFISNDNIIQFKYKMYLNPAKPVTGN